MQPPAGARCVQAHGRWLWAGNLRADCNSGLAQCGIAAACEPAGVGMRKRVPAPAACPPQVMYEYAAWADRMIGHWKVEADGHKSPNVSVGGLCVQHAMHDCRVQAGLH